MIRFNTHRTYTKYGQRIAAMSINNNSTTHDIAFADVDRGIFGIIRRCNLSPVAIMSCYDSGDYEASISLEDGFGFPEVRKLERFALGWNEGKADLM